MAAVNEGSSSFITLTFRDQVGMAVVPSAARYRLDMGDEVLKEWTSVTPSAATHVLTVTPTENAVPGTMRCTVEWTYDTDKQGTADATYLVVALERYP